MTRSVEPGPVGGTARAPASKSATQRALACAAMARGTSSIRNPAWCDDSLAAIAVIEALGAAVERREGRIAIRGGLQEGNGPLRLSCGESALCMRVFAAVASLLSVPVELRGEGSLARRPMGMVEEALKSLGAECSTAAGLPPVRVRGPIRAGKVRVDGSASSQFLSGLLMALPMAGGGSEVTVDGLASRGYIDLTLDVMKTFGASVEREPCNDVFRVSGIPYSAADYDVEGDWSGAAFMFAAGALAADGSRGPLEISGLSPLSSQPDRAILAALELAGARVSLAGGTWAVSAGPLRPFEFDAGGCPDLFPPLVALASRCRGTTALRGVSRLRGKESDRAEALRGEFASLGLGVDVDGDTMLVRGLGPEGRLRPCRVSSRGDHRIAMALAIAALAADGAVLIDGAESVGKSWPGFWESLDSISG